MSNIEKIILYLNKEKTLKINFKDMDELEDYFKNIFLKIKRQITDISGFYIINIYLDHYYGSIIEIKKEDIDYVYYYENQIEMKIIIHDTNFLYQVEDFFDINKLNDYIEKYYYKNKYYIKIKKEINSFDFAKMLEMSKVIYKTDNILFYGKKI